MDVIELSDTHACLLRARTVDFERAFVFERTPIFVLCARFFDCRMTGGNYETQPHY